MGNVLIHIGYPKCGSTFIQKRVLPGLLGLMLSRSATDERLASRILNELKKPDCNAEVIRSEIRNECFIKEKLCPVTKNNCSRCIVSHENLSGLTRSVATGNKIAHNLKSCYPTAKILIIIRNQWDVLESLCTHHAAI